MIRLIAFDLSGTLIERTKPYPPIVAVAALVGNAEKATMLLELHHAGKLAYEEIIPQIMALSKGAKVRDLNNIFTSFHFFENVAEIVLELKRMKIKLALISTVHRQLAELVAKKLNFDYVYATEVEVKNGEFTGNVIRAWSDKGAAIKDIMKKEKLEPEECMAVGDSRGDIGMFESVGTSVLFRPKLVNKEIANYVINDFRDIIKLAEQR